MDNAAVANDAALVLYFSGLVNQLIQVRDLMNKEGGVTKEDMAGLIGQHESVRQATQDIIDAMPDDTVFPSN